MSGRLLDELLGEVKARADIVAIVGRSVRLTRRGPEFVGLCPFHKEKTGSFTVTPRKGFFHCFGCGANGSAIGFVMRAYCLEFPDAVRMLAEDLGVAPADPGAKSKPRKLVPILPPPIDDGEAELEEARKREWCVNMWRAGNGLRTDLVARYLRGAASTCRCHPRSGLCPTCCTPKPASACHAWWLRSRT